MREELHSASVSGVGDTMPTVERVSALPVLEQHERDAIQDADAQLSDLQDALQDAAQHGAVDPEVFDRLTLTAREVSARVNRDLPLHLDADARDEVRRRLVELLTLPTDGQEPLDVADAALLETEAVRHILRDVLHEQPPADLRNAGALVRLLEEWVPDLTVRQLAELLGLSERALQRRRAEGGASTSRQQVVARLIAILRRGWTDQGVYAWFHRERPTLGDTAPIALLDDPSRERDLISEARAGRVQGGG